MTRLKKWARAVLKAAAHFFLGWLGRTFDGGPIRAFLDLVVIRWAFRSRWTAAGRNEVLRMVESMDRIFGEAGLSYMAYAGTLLGIMRHGGLIPWDDDIDFCIEGCDEQKFLGLKEPLARAGLCIVDSPTCYKLCWMKNRPVRPGLAWSWPFIDIFLWDKAGDRLVSRDPNARDHYPYRCFFPLKRAYFHRVAVPVPREPEAVLAAWYGPDFMTVAVSPTFIHRREKNAIGGRFVTPYPLPAWSSLFSRGKMPHRQLCELLLRAGTKFLDACGVEFWADYGTLLGIYRSGVLLPQERNVDLALMEESFSLLMRNLHLLDADFEFCDLSHPTDGPRGAIRHRKFGGNCDLFVYRRLAGHELGICLGEAHHGTMDARNIPVEMVFPLHPSKIYNFTVKCPAQTREYLIHRYGYIDAPAVLKDDGSGHYRMAWKQDPCPADTSSLPVEVN